MDDQTRLLETHRRALTGHCYRMLGSPVDADDAVQETMLRAWRKLDDFDGRSSLKTWLYRIATHVCLDALSDRSRRHRSIEETPVHTVDAPLETKSRSHWLEPVPEALVIPSDAAPDERVILRQSIRLAFVAALQHLPPKQRAVLLLTEVVGCPATEVAQIVDASVASVNSALQRARATLATRDLADPASTELTDSQQQMVDRYVAAFERYDTVALTALMAEDATLSMPPYTLWLQGRESINAWLLGRGAGCRGSKLIPVDASGAPAFVQYREGGRHPFALIVLDVRGDRIAGMTSFLDTPTLFPLFGMPERLVG